MPGACDAFVVGDVEIRHGRTVSPPVGPRPEFRRKGWEHTFVSHSPTILHADVDAFYASVAQRDDPRLRGRPVLVGSWVVMAASYEARAHGVGSGMPGSRARRLCPDAIVVSPCWPAYVEASRAVFAIFERLAPSVQRASMEEAFLDAAGGDLPAPELAVRLRRSVREEVGLPLSVGVARTRALAKMASRAAKPDGLLVVEPGREDEFLHPLPVERIWGVGEATAGRLRARGLDTVGAVAALDEGQLMAILGKAAGRYVHAVAHHREPPAVQRRRGRRSFGAQRALRPGPRSREELDGALADLAERLASRMERKGRAGRTVVLRLRFRDYTRASRAHTLASATADAAAIAATAGRLLDEAMELVTRQGVTLVGLTVTNLQETGGGDQLALPVAEPSGDER